LAYKTLLIPYISVHFSIRHMMPVFQETFSLSFRMLQCALASGVQDDFEGH